MKSTRMVNMWAYIKAIFLKSILKISNMLKKKNNVGYVKYVEIKYITTIT